MVYATRCPNGYLAVDDRTRQIVSTGKNCPPQRETRQRARLLVHTRYCLFLNRGFAGLQITMVDSVSAIKLSRALGDDVDPTATGGPPSPNAWTRNITNQIGRLLSRSGRRKRYPFSPCTCPCSEGASPVERVLVVVVDSSCSISADESNKAVDAMVKLLLHLCHFSSPCNGNDITRLASLQEYKSLLT